MIEKTIVEPLPNTVFFRRVKIAAFAINTERPPSGHRDHLATYVDNGDTREGFGAPRHPISWSALIR